MHLNNSGIVRILFLFYVLFLVFVFFLREEEVYFCKWNYFYIHVGILTQHIIYAFSSINC